MTKRIQESGKLTLDATKSKFRVRLINEGAGSSADYPPEFFNQENADALAGALSFPNHPFDVEHPEHRDPLTAIGYIGDKVDIETAPDGTKEMWADYHPAASKPEVGAFLAEFSTKVGLSIYADSEGREDPVTKRWIAESISANDPYRSVDLVVAPGRGGKFGERLAESYRLITESSATAEGKEKDDMLEKKDVEDAVAAAFAPIKTLVESLTTKLGENAPTADELQATVDAAAVEKAVESRIADYDKAVSLISEAKLTESQTAELKELAKTGASIEDITAKIESAKNVVAEALALSGADDQGTHRHLGEAAIKQATEQSFAVAGFGEV